MTRISEKIFEACVPQIQLSYHPHEAVEDRVSICSSSEAYNAFMTLWDMGTLALKETFNVAYLNKANHLLGISTVSEGGISAAIVEVRHILAVGIISNCSSIILAHNHPSGKLKPSQTDMVLTRRVIEAAALFDIKVLDHVIVSAESYYSMGDEGEIDALLQKAGVLIRDLGYVKEGQQ